jgi:hypothetical protein
VPNSVAQGADPLQVQHSPLHQQPQLAPGYAGVHAPPPRVAGHVQQVVPPPGVVRQPLPPQSQLAAQLGVLGRGGRAGFGANADNSAAVSAETILANAPTGVDGNPLGRIFVGGLPQVSAEWLMSPDSVTHLA